MKKIIDLFGNTISRKELLRLFPKTYNHDKYCTSLFSILELSYRIFKVILPKDLLNELDLDHFEIIDTKFITTQLRVNHCDMLYRFPLQEDPKSWVYFLIDFKSNNDPDAATQLFRYATTIWMKLWGDEGEPRNFHFPCILAMIFHCGKSKFTSATNVANRVNLPKKSQLRKNTINFKVHKYDVNSKRSESELPHDPIVKMMFSILKIARYKDVNKHSLTIFKQFKEHIRTDKLFAVVWDTSLWYLYTSAKHFTREMFDQLTTLTKKLGVKVMSTSAFKTHMKEVRILSEARGEAKGEAKGEARGEARGEAKGIASAIIRLLNRRVGEPSLELQDKIKSIRSIDKLDELLDFAITCVSLGEFETAFN
ncbi:MAG: Rpn family recombination-promoting nuclease/putative transposase [Planctomycetaceae bacterium]|jgi:hypothetical protein|nr:Rpn family recombination-promoting nuclease/putative transposase [Planctomycetaceae bacterium]